MILSGPEIARLCTASIKGTRSLSIAPFNPAYVNPNSYNVRIADKIARVVHLPQEGQLPRWPGLLDMAAVPLLVEASIPLAGYLLHPGTLYLANTIESITASGLVPLVDGRSGAGRMGLAVHCTAGFCDDNFSGQIVLELSVVQPLWIYPNIPIAQVSFWEMSGERQPYHGNYQDQQGIVGSKLYKEVQAILAEQRAGKQ